MSRYAARLRLSARGASTLGIGIMNHLDTRSAVYRFALASLLALAAVACRSGSSGGPSTGAAPSAGAARADAPDVSIRIPAAVGTFKLMGRHDYEDRAAGTQLMYRGAGGLAADAYVYPAPKVAEGCAACADSLVNVEALDFVGAIPEFIRRGYFSSAAGTQVETLDPSPGVAWLAGRHVAFSVVRDGKAGRTDFYLFLLRGYRVKVRATYSDAPAAREQVRAFTEELLRILPANHVTTP
jgi:hypothetical protein